MVAPSRERELKQPGRGVLSVFLLCRSLTGA